MSESLRRQLPSFVHARPNSVVHVQIEQLNKRQHQGILTCKIVNEVGYDERPIRVTFIRKFSTFSKYLTGKYLER